MNLNLSMRVSIILSVIALVWGTHILLAPSFYLLSEKTFYDHARDIMDNISDFTLEQSYNHLDKAKSAVSLTKHLLTANVVSTGSFTINSLERYFFDQLQIHPHLAGIFLGTPDGSFYYVSRNEKQIADGFRTKIIRQRNNSRSVTLIWRDRDFKEIFREDTPSDSYDPRIRPWYKQAVRNHSIGWTSPYIFYTSQQPGVTISGPSYWKDNSLKGVVGVDIDLKELSSFVSRLRIGKNGQAFIFDRDRNVIASRNLARHIVKEDDGNGLRLPKLEELNQSTISKAMAAVSKQINSYDLSGLKKPVFTSFTDQGNDFVAMFTPFPGDELDWIIGMYIPENDYLGEIRANRRYNLIATIILSLLASLLALRFARAIISPIRQLQQEARAIEEQTPGPECSIDSIFTEIRETADGFNRMKQSITHYREELLAREKMYRTITQAASDAIILINEKGEISYINPAAEDFFSLNNEEAQGKEINDLIDIPLEPENHSQNEQAPSQKSPPVELRITNEKGLPATVEVTLSKIAINKEKHTVAILRDISERCRSAELKKQLVQDLHDGVGGNLVNIKLLSQMVVNGNITQPVESIFSDIADICDDSIVEIRSFMDILDTKNVTWETLTAELHQQCAKVAESHQLVFTKHSDISKSAPQPSPLVVLNFFKIIKEGMTNIIRHAGAEKIHLNIQVTGASLYCHLADDGKGTVTTEKTGRGMSNMKNRAKQVGGTLSINVNRGTTISLEIPLLQ